MEYLQYKNTVEVYKVFVGVLNLVISGIPSILPIYRVDFYTIVIPVLNLVISGIPSILYH